MTETTQQVRDFYHRRPYPHYPLLAKPRWQDGYLGSSLFARTIHQNTLRDYRNPQRFLSIGSGEILPYIIRQWEPSGTLVDCVDLSQTSIRRAQFRTALLGRKINFHCNDVNQLLSSGCLHDKKFDHIEAYGVLHHISTFTTTLSLLSSHLSPTGTMRIMIYNADARDWIWQINRALRCLGLRFESNTDIHIARTILFELCKSSPRLDYRLRQLGIKSLKNNTRFADTFLHPWEARANILQWFTVFQDKGLEPFALYDRYAELDDLQNPLWQCPTAKSLQDRSLDLRFENNLEIWLTHKNVKTIHHGNNSQQSSAGKIPVRLRLTMPPINFRRYSETQDLSLGAKLILWQGFLKGLHNITDDSSVNLIKDMDNKTASRLARIGLILPHAAQGAHRFEELMAPMTSRMAPPLLPEASNQLILPNLLKLCRQVCADPKRVELATLRLQRVI
jgi:SAM-dependent methyltransferase